MEHILFQEDELDKQMETRPQKKRAATERGTYVSEIGNKSMHTILS